MSLATVQQAALDRLVALCTFASTGLRKVYPDPPDALGPLPCLVLSDEGMHPRRAGQWQEIEWRLHLQAFVQRGKLASALKACRDLRGNLIDTLDTDITLAGTVSRTTWEGDGLRLVSLEYPPGIEHAGLDGTYVLWIRENKAFA